MRKTLISESLIKAIFCTVLCYEEAHWIFYRKIYWACQMKVWPHIIEKNVCAVVPWSEDVFMLSNHLVLEKCKS